MITLTQHEHGELGTYPMAEAREVAARVANESGHTVALRNSAGRVVMSVVPSAKVRAAHKWWVREGA